MQSSKTPLYKAVPAEDAPQQPLDQDSATRLQPKRLDNSKLTIGLRLIFDLLVASISLLFAVFGFLVYRSHGKPADAGSTGLKLFQIAQFVRFPSSVVSNSFLTRNRHQPYSPFFLLL